MHAFFPLFFFPHYPFKLIFTATGLFWVASAGGELKEEQPLSFTQSCAQSRVQSAHAEDTGTALFS